MDPDISIARDLFVLDGKKEIKTIKKYTDQIKGAIKVFEQKKMVQLVIYGVTLIEFRNNFENLKISKTNRRSKRYSINDKRC